jgi:hypothetical protein
MQKPLRYLRIALSATCGISCVLLLSLWVRSYWRSDSLSGPILWPHGCSLTSTNGRLMIGAADEQDPITEWDFLSSKFDDPGGAPIDPQFLPPVFSFHPSEEDGAYIHVPHWFLALIAGSIAFVLARPRRYTLRTLLIVVTLVAIGFGLIAYYSTHTEQKGFGGGGAGGLAFRCTDLRTIPDSIRQAH